MPKCSIVIPTYNHCEDLLKPCVESILKYTDMSRIELIISANGCTDGTAQYLEELKKRCGQVVVVWNANSAGYTKSTNDGIKVSTGDYILLLNNDTVILDQQHDTWINMLLQPFENPKVGMTGPMKAWCPYAKKEFLIFFCAMIKREMIDKIGLLDEMFNPGFGEDTDFAVKMQNLGYEIVQVPDTKHHYSKPNFMVGGMPIYHKGEGTFADYPGGEKLLAERRFMLMNRYAEGIKLNLGCGDRRIDGYFNIDIGNSKADLVWDVRKIPLDDNKVDEIVAIHLIEHFPIQEVPNIVREWKRVLKPNGKLVLEFPDVQALFKAFETSDEAGRKHIIDCVYGAHMPEFPHLFGWYDVSIWKLLHDMDFENITKMAPQVDHWGINMRVECTKIGDLPEGFFWGHDIATYRDWFSNRIPVGGKVAELGCWKGKSLSSVADIIKAKKIQVVAIDTFMGSEDESNLADGATPTKAVADDVHGTFLQNMARVGLSPTVLKMTTHEASQLFKDGEFDMVFIDADHSYEAVRQDVQDWWLKVKRGGFIAGHDCMWKSVADALTAEFGHLVLTNTTNIWWVNKHKVYDCFPFCKEFEQLEIRLNELDSEVDYFVLVEGTETHSGLKKPLYFEENKERFAKWLPKIRHIVVDKWPEYVAGVSDSSWARERAQRDAAMQGLHDATDYDVVITGDADEVIDVKSLRSYRRHMGICKLEMSLYYYFLNYQSSDGNGKWYESRILPVAELRRQNLVFSTTRYIPLHTLPTLHNAGWHWSFQGGVDEVMKKIQSWAHQEYNRPDILDRDRVERLIDEGKDVFGREQMTYHTVSIDETFPQYVRDNTEKFKTMIREAKVEVAS